MQWTPDMIRQKAEAMDRRLAQPSSAISRDTLGLVVEALRFFAAHAFVDRREGYTVEVADLRRGTIGEWVGQVADLATAEVLLNHVVASRPRARVTIRKGGWVVRVGLADPAIPPPLDPDVA